MEKNMHQKIDEIIERFPNGKELYASSAMFNQVVQMMARGVSIELCMEQIIYNVQDNQNAFTEYVKREMPRSILIGDKLYNYKTPNP